MIKVEVIEKFTLADYMKLKNVKKVTTRKENEFGVGDTFECDEEMAKYLTGENKDKKVVIKILEVIPETVGTIKYDVDNSKKLKVNFKSTKDEENIIPLDEENIKKIGKELEKTILTKEKKQKTSKKKTSKKGKNIV